MAKVGTAQRIFAHVVGLALLLPTLVLVLGYTSQRLTFADPCTVPDAESAALFDYMAFYSCAQVLPTPLKALLLLVWLIILISLLASTADLFFVPQLDAMSRDLGLPEDVAGVTLLALGNGMPDVMTATSSINKADDFALTMGEMLGAANWILSLVLGCCLLFKAGSTKVDAYPFMRDSIAYLVVLLFMVAVTWDGTVGIFESLLFFVLYVVYVAIVVLPGRLTRRKLAFAREGSPRQPPLDHSMNSSIEFQDMHVSPGFENIPMDDSDDELLAHDFQESDSADFMLLESDSEATSDDMDVLEGLSDAEGIFGWLQITLELPFTIARHASIPAANWNHKRRALAAGCPIFSSIVLLLSFGGWEAFSTKWGFLPLWLCCLLISAIFAFAVLLGSTPEQRPRWHGLLLLLAFLCCIAWFNLLANECVAVLETFGIKFGISSSVLGITVLAWGNSVGDLVADTALVKQGKSRMAVAGVFGSPLLSDLLGLGVSFTSYNLSNGPLYAKLSMQNKVAAAFLLVSIAITVITFLAFRFSGPRRLGLVLLVHYGIFMVVAVLGETGLLYHLDLTHHSLSLAGTTESPSVAVNTGSPSVVDLTHPLADHG